MSPQPFVDQEHAWIPCPYCGALTYEGIQHDCREGADEQTTPVELAVTLLAIGGILGVLAWLIARAVA